MDIQVSTPVIPPPFKPTPVVPLENKRILATTIPKSKQPSSTCDGAAVQILAVVVTWRVKGT